jgi:arsenate reductase (thioredoxin)
MVMIRKKMNQNLTVVFVCEHGAAKSIVAAAYFNHLASEAGLDLRAIARGTTPDDELSPQTFKGLAEDGLTPSESSPQKLTEADMQSAQRVITFCELPNEYKQQVMIERWNNVPPVSEDYEKARDVIIKNIRQMLDR